MFPINYDDPYLKANGDIVPIGDIIGGGGGGSELPPHTVADAGKVLTVTDENALAWEELPPGTNNFSKVTISPELRGVTIDVKKGV